MRKGEPFASLGRWLRDRLRRVRHSGGAFEKIDATLQCCEARRELFESFRKVVHECLPRKRSSAAL
jgi:hypothetical protein